VRAASQAPCEKDAQQARWGRFAKAVMVARRERLETEMARVRLEAVALSRDRRAAVRSKVPVEMGLRLRSRLSPPKEAVESVRDEAATEATTTLVEGHAMRLSRKGRPCLRCSSPRGLLEARKNQRPSVGKNATAFADCRRVCRNSRKFIYNG